MGPLLSSISVLSLTATATAAVKAKQFVTVAGAPAGAGEAVLGVSQTDAAARAAFAVDAIGVFDMRSGAAIALGAEVQSDADGLPITKAAGVGVGIALTAAANPGDIVKILIK